MKSSNQLLKLATMNSQYIGEMESVRRWKDVQMVVGIRILESVENAVGIILCQLRTLTSTIQTRACTYQLGAWVGPGGFTISI